MKGLGTPAGNGRILHFDIENRPLSYWYDGNPTAEVTAIASCWADDPLSMEVTLLSIPCRHHGWACKDMQPYEMDGIGILKRFVRRYREADMVSGHYVRRHDLPIINGALMEHGMDLLGEKMVSDTKVDMPKKSDIPANQEYLLELFRLQEQKYHMSQVKWREANRLTPEGLAETYSRVSSDVRGHILLRQEMLKRGLLRRPRMWDPKSAAPAA